ncbi:MAG TPA: YciI family protein [Myxococcaceae bacterium]|nr:YciI family protein [Myxococcaceae bacterium]
MQYIVLIYGSEKGWSSMSKPQVEQMYAEYAQYSQDLAKAGVLRAGSELKPASTATTVRVRGGKRQVTDGPFAETKEQLGGYYVIEVPNLESALDWAARCPSARDGSIEVRPLAQSAQG